MYSKNDFDMYAYKSFALHMFKNIPHDKDWGRDARITLLTILSSPSSSFLDIFASLRRCHPRGSDGVCNQVATAAWSSYCDCVNSWIQWLWSQKSGFCGGAGTRAQSGVLFGTRRVANQFVGEVIIQKIDDSLVQKPATWDRVQHGIQARTHPILSFNRLLIVPWSSLKLFRTCFSEVLAGFFRRRWIHWGVPNLTNAPTCIGIERRIVWGVRRVCGSGRRQAWKMDEFKYKHYRTAARGGSDDA